MRRFSFLLRATGKTVPLGAFLRRIQGRPSTTDRSRILTTLFQGGAGTRLHEACGGDGGELDRRRAVVDSGRAAGAVVLDRLDQLLPRGVHLHRGGVSAAGTGTRRVLCAFIEQLFLGAVGGQATLVFPQAQSQRYRRYYQPPLVQLAGDAVDGRHRHQSQRDQQHDQVDTAGDELLMRTQQRSYFLYSNELGLVSYEK
jgi:hypothetical protein